jgi:hypothetical protein
MMAVTDMYATLEAVASVRVLRMYNEGQLPLRGSREMAVGRVGWFEMVASLGGRQFESRGMSIVGSRCQAVH